MDPRSGWPMGSSTGRPRRVRSFAACGRPSGSMGANSITEVPAVIRITAHRLCISCGEPLHEIGVTPDRLPERPELDQKRGGDHRSPGGALLASEGLEAIPREPDLCGPEENAG